ncbi:MAG: hypothetical protein R3Y59_06490 [bacterium]
MRKLTKILPKVTLYGLLIVSLIFTMMFWLGGGSDVVINNETWNEPAYTALYLNWAYVLCGLALFFTLMFALVYFVTGFIASPKKGLITLLVIALFAAVFVVSWSLGSDAKMEIIGYDGTDNVGVMAQYSDMCLYATYILVGAILVTLFGTALYSKVR